MNAPQLISNGVRSGVPLRFRAVRTLSLGEVMVVRKVQKIQVVNKYSDSLPFFRVKVRFSYVKFVIFETKVTGTRAGRVKFSFFGRIRPRFCVTGTENSINP